MFSARRLGALAFLTTVVAAGAARAACALAQITTEPASLAGHWQTAILDVVEQTTRTGTPWSCAGGALLLRVVDDDRAVLRFRDPDGHEVERHVPSPRALVATAEALMARALPHEAPRPRPPVDESESEAERPPPGEDGALVRPTRARREPRYIVDATLGIRFSGPSAALWFAPELRATVPFDAWSVGVWARYGLPHVLGPLPVDSSISQVNVGFSAGRQLVSTLDLVLPVLPAYEVGAALGVELVAR